jgi:hypothetical protein
VTKKIEDAIDLALAVLEEHRNRVEDQNYDPYSSAFFHEELSVCSDVRGPALERENSVLSMGRLNESGGRCCQVGTH